jgi:twitching motility protein PilJ
MEATVRLGHSTLSPPDAARADSDDSSIISEAAPSELAADYTETRAQGGSDEAERLFKRPADHRRLAAGCASSVRCSCCLVGLLGLLLHGLAGHQCQQPQRVPGGRRRRRPARSRSVWPSRPRRPWSAMPAAFPEVQESAGRAGRQRAQPENRRGATCRPCRARLQEQVETLLPLVDRAEKNAALVMGQQKVTDPGRPGPARHQPPERGPAGNRRNRFVAEAAGRRVGGRVVGGGPAW